MSKYLKQRPVKTGLYDPEFERDSCGVGLVANIKGVPSREIMEKCIFNQLENGSQRWVWL
jgi:glutamate synthase (ferredoxin)